MKNQPTTAEISAAIEKLENGNLVLTTKQIFFPDTSGVNIFNPIESLMQAMQYEGCAVMLSRRDNGILLIYGVIEVRGDKVFITDNMVKYDLSNHDLCQNFYCITTGKPIHNGFQTIIRDGELWRTSFNYYEPKLHVSMGAAFEYLFQNGVKPTSIKIDLS